MTATAISLLVFLSLFAPPLISIALRANNYSFLVATINGYALTLALILFIVALVKSDGRFSINHLKRILTSLIHDKGLLLLVLLFVWIAVSSLANPDPAVALLGSVEDYSDAGLFYLAVLGIATFTYLETKKNPRVHSYLLLTVLFGGFILALLAVYETFTGRALLFEATPRQLPLVLFPGKGHLAGFMLMPIAAALAHLNIWTLGALFLFSFVIGNTYNRSSWIGEALVTLGAYFGKKQWLVVGLTLAIGLFAGLYSVRTILPGGGERVLSNPITIEARYYYWLSAARGIMERPLFGWGGGAYYMHWAKFLSEDELRAFFEKHGLRLIAPGQLFFLVERPDGEKVLQRITGWKAHNQFLDVALMWGFPGLLIYISLLIMLIKPFFRGDPAAVAVVAYHAFLMFWFMPAQAAIPLWALWAAALARAEES